MPQWLKTGVFFIFTLKRGQTLYCRCFNLFTTFPKEVSWLKQRKLATPEICSKWQQESKPIQVRQSITQLRTDCCHAGSQYAQCFSPQANTLCVSHLLKMSQIKLGHWPNWHILTVLEFHPGNLSSNLKNENLATHTYTSISSVTHHQDTYWTTDR